MKIFKKLSVLFFVAMGIVSCEKNIDSDDLSFITNYANFAMEGDELVLLTVGEIYIEPGVVATETGQEIPVTVSVVGNIQSYSGTTWDTELENEYVVSYSATNSDGYSSVTNRYIWVANTGDLVTSIEGLYVAKVVRDVAPKEFDNLNYVMIYKTGTNSYAISDGIGGYYALGRGYGPAYYAAAEVVANDIPSNNFSYEAFGVGAFGGVAEMSGLTVDPVAKTITFTTIWDAGYTFEVTLTQVSL